MKNRTQDSRLRILSRAVYLTSCVLCLVSCVCFCSISFAQEENEEKDKITDLPAVKIEIIDTTQINIPREKFRSFTKPDPRLYVPLSSKERPWYLPPTSIPEKIRETQIEAEKDFLFSVSAHSGVPAILAYQILLVRDFGNSEALLDIGRASLSDKRTAEKQGGSTVDRFRGAFAHQRETLSLRTDAQYNARELIYLDKNGEEFPDEDKRTLVDLSVDWDQKLSRNARSALNLKLSNLRMKGPLSSGDESGLDLRTNFGVNAPWPRSNPIEAGLGVEYFVGENDSEEFREAILRLYLRDKYIRIWAFVLGAGVEVVLDAHKRIDGDEGTEDKWESYVYPNPYALLTSQIGIRTTLQFGVERRVSRQNLKSLYLDKDCVRYNPDLDVERIWDLNASIQYRLTRKFTATIGAFDKEIRNLTFFEKIDDEIVSWEPRSWDSARIFGFGAGWDLSLIDDKLKQSIEYTHESDDQEEHIPYRSKDKGSFALTYYAPVGLELSLVAEFHGTRYVDTVDDKTLSSYFLLKPRVSKTFGRYASVFLGAEFCVGKDDYQIWEDYILPSQIVDFGLTLRF